jgi:3-oxoacyl-(acyl-carrier-protein) synthase
MSVHCIDWWRDERAFAAPAFDDASRWIATSIADRIRGTDAERTGVYVATGDAGVEASLALWREALEQGADFANPRAFPWTLASSLAGHIAATAGVRGPVYTLVGAQEAAAAAAAHAAADLERGRVDTAIVGGADMCGDVIRAAFIILRAGTAAPARNSARAGTGTDSAARAFGALIDALEAGSAVSITAPYEPDVTVQLAMVIESAN